MDWIHRHPYLTGFLVLAAIVLFFIIRGRSSSSAQPSQGGPSEALQAANLQAQTGIQTAQLAAGVEQSKIATAAAVQGDIIKGSLAAKQLDAATATELANTQAQAYLGGLVIQGRTATDVASLNAQGNIATSQYAFETAQVQAGNQVAIANINAGAGMKIAGIQAMLEAHKADTALATQQDINATQLGISRVAADVAKTGIAAEITKSQITAGVDIHALDVSQNINASQQQTIRLANAGKVSVAKDLIAGQTAVGLAQTQVEISQSAVQKQIVANQTNIADQLAHGGLGNKNRATVASLFFPQGAQVGAAIQYGGAATTGGMWAGIGSIVNSIFGGPVGAGVGAAIHP